MTTLVLTNTGNVAFAAEPDTEDGGTGSGTYTFNLGSFWDIMNKAVNKPAPEPVYVEVTRYNCNCGFTTYDYNELKQHMYQHLLKGQRNSYCTSYVEVLQ